MKNRATERRPTVPTKKKKAVKYCVVMKYDVYGNPSRPPYLDTMENAISSCIKYNMSQFRQDEIESGKTKSEEVEMSFFLATSMIKQGKHRKAWNIWTDAAVHTGGGWMWWYRLGKKPSRH